MVGVAGQAVADHFGVDLGAARLGVLQLLQHDDAGALAHHEAVAVLVVGTRGLLRLVVEGGAQRAAGGKAGNGDAADRALGSARHHHVGIVELDQPRRVADRMRAGRAGGDDRVVRPLQAVPDGDIAGRQIDQASRDEERADAARPLLLEQDGGVGDAGQAADAGADQDAGALLLLLRVGLPAGVLERLRGRRHAVDDEVVDLALLLGLHPVVGIEVALGLGAARNEAGDLAGEVGDLELLDAAGAAVASDQPRPARIDAASERRHEAEPGDDDASQHA